MSLVNNVTSSFAALSLLALSSACGPSDGPAIGVGSNYAIDSSISGDIDQLRDFDAEGETDVSTQGKIFSAVTTASFGEQEALTNMEYFGETLFAELPAGTVLHSAADGDTDLLDLVNPDLDQLIDNAALNVTLSGGDVRPDAEEDVDINSEDYWFSSPADEVVVEIAATDDPLVRVVTMTAATINVETEELDVVITVFDLQLNSDPFDTVVSTSF